MMDILTASFCILGIYICFQEGNILFPVKQFLDKYLDRGIGRYIATPLYQCLTCMASIHGTWLFFVLGVDINYFVFIFALAGCNLIFDIGLEIYNS
jgi:hypothetical protein